MFQIIYEPIEFPAVTFCNLNNIKSSKVSLGGPQLVKVIADIENALQGPSDSKRKKRQIKAKDKKNNIIRPEHNDLSATRDIRAEIVHFEGMSNINHHSSHDSQFFKRRHMEVMSAEKKPSSKLEKNNSLSNTPETENSIELEDHIIHNEKDSIFQHDQGCGRKRTKRHHWDCKF